MKATQAYVAFEPSKRKDEILKPYLICIPESGPIGDRLNSDASRNGTRFPRKASSRFQFKKNAEFVCQQFIKYAKQKIQDAQAGYIPPNTDPNALEKNPRKPSYFLWE